MINVKFIACYLILISQHNFSLLTLFSHFDFEGNLWINITHILSKSNNDFFFLPPLIAITVVSARNQSFFLSIGNHSSARQFLSLSSALSSAFDSFHLHFLSWHKCYRKLNKYTNRASGQTEVFSPINTQCKYPSDSNQYLHITLLNLWQPNIPSIYHNHK